MGNGLTDYISGLADCRLDAIPKVSSLLSKSVQSQYSLVLAVIPQPITLRVQPIEFCDPAV